MNIKEEFHEKKVSTKVIDCCKYVLYIEVFLLEFNRKLPCLLQLGAHSVAKNSLEIDFAVFILTLTKKLTLNI